MKSITKLLSAGLAALMLASLVSCGGDEKESSKKVVEDTAVMGMSFGVPEEFKSVERTVQKSTDGKLIAKGITYEISDNCRLEFVFTIAEGRSLEDEIGDMTVDRKEYNGTSLIVYKPGKKNYMAFYQDGDNVYGIQYKSPNEDAIDDEFDKILQTVKFTDATETTLNDFTLDKIKYNTEVDIPLLTESTNIEENADGTLVCKSYSWEYSKDSEKTAYRFGIDQYINTKLEDKLKEDKEYTEAKIGDITYTFEKGDEGTDTYDHYNYYVQYGDDVYVIKNMGTGSWFVSRSDESKAAFKGFIQAITFE